MMLGEDQGGVVPGPPIISLPPGGGGQGGVVPGPPIISLPPGGGGSGWGGIKAVQTGKRFFSPPSRDDLSRFLLVKNSDAAPAGGSDRGEMPSKWTETTDRFG
jgi:hypothetical protein